MTTVRTKSGKVIKVVSREEERDILTSSENEMDARAVEAVIAGPNGSGKSTITTFFDKVGINQLIT